LFCVVMLMHCSHAHVPIEPVSLCWRAPPPPALFNVVSFGHWSVVV